MDWSWWSVWYHFLQCCLCGACIYIWFVARNQRSSWSYKVEKPTKFTRASLNKRNSHKLMKISMSPIPTTPTNSIKTIPILITTRSRFLMRPKAKPQINYYVLSIRNNIRGKILMMLSIFNWKDNCQVCY